MREEVRSSSGAAAEPPPTPVASSAGPSSPAMQANVASIDWSDKLPELIPHHMLLRMPISLLIVSMPLELLWILHRHVGHGNAETYFVDWQHISLQLGLLGLSSLACARRGWVNVDVDKIECESCGAHLIFSTLTSWSPAEELIDNS
uniref:C3HC-type domain-containing protein n=1 Tax=Oryza meridionalis TaxID=40149 RepID=A0A0E0D7V5_9ORYZ